MRIIGFVLLFILLGFKGFSREIKYPASAIPEDLKNNANVVIRESNTTFTIVAKDEARYHVREVLTILNAEGKSHAVAYVRYDNLTKVLNFSGQLYNADGDFVRRIKKSDIYDQSLSPGYSVGDSRVQVVDLSQGTYPYTVEFEYELKYKYLFQIPGYALVPDEKVALQQATFSLIFPTTLAPRYKVINLTEQPVATNDKGIETVEWVFENKKPIKGEVFGPAFSEIVPRILVAPSTFEYEGYAGSMDSWENFGKWISALNEGRGILDESAKSKVKALTAGLVSKKEKVRKLYEYMQSRTRYLSIQFGIGGFQPFEAKEVDKTGYGDCKALSNYMVTLLKEAGIESFYTLVNSGSNPMSFQTDFPSPQFDHVIVAVPNESDTIWLECTSQTNPFGYIGTFTDDRYALMILEDGAKLVKTPVYKAEDNVQARKADVFVGLNGEANAKVTTSYSGIQYENGGLMFVLNQQDELKKWINNHTDIPSFDLNTFEVSNDKKPIPTATLELDLSVIKLASANGKRLFLNPNLMNRNGFIPERTEERKTDIIVRREWTDFDTIRYHISEQLYPEFIPEPVHIESEFGVYDSSCSLEEGVLIYTRKLKIVKGKFPLQQYQEFADFYQNIKKADNNKAVFLNKT